MPQYPYVIEIDVENEIRVRIVVFRGIVVSFTLQYETQINGRWYPVVRYDNAHGYAHGDVLDEEGRTVSKRPIPGTLNDAVQYANPDYSQPSR